MPSVAAALLAMALRDPRPLTDTGVWLDPVSSTRVVAPLDVTGEAQAPEGVLRLDLYVVRGATVTKVATYEPALPVGTVPFTLRWDPRGARPGTVTLRVVATTLVRGLDAEVTGLSVPAPPAPRPVARPRPAPPRVAPRPVTVAAKPVLARYVAPRWDDSGTAFGTVSPVLPYVARTIPSQTVAVPRDVAPQAFPRERSGWVFVAAGLLVLLVCSHLHRALRPQPDPRGGR